jgi:hypothetical protein
MIEYLRPLPLAIEDGAAAAESSAQDKNDVLEVGRLGRWRKLSRNWHR